MKTIINLGFTVLMAVFVILPSCKKSDAVKVTLLEVLTGSDLQVHLYQEGSEDKTSDYTGYLWTFKPDGSLVVTRGALTFNGSWILTQAGDTRLNILFAGTGVDAVLQKLQKNWQVTDYSVDLIQLKDDSTPTIEILHFAPK
jgi:hypothetical protein